MPVCRLVRLPGTADRELHCGVSAFCPLGSLSGVFAPE
jgi:hypothetical protein